MLDISDLLHTGRKNKTCDRRLLKSVVIDPKQRFGKGNRLQFFAGMESTPLDRLHLLTKCHVTQVCTAAAAPLRDRFQTIRKMQRRESAARKAVAPQIFQAIRQVDMLQALAAGKCPPENSLDRPRQDHLRDGRVLEHFLADADDRLPADLRRNDDTLRIKPGVGRDSEPLADQLLQRTQENIIRLMSLRILRASYRAFFSSGSVL